MQTIKLPGKSFSDVKSPTLHGPASFRIRMNGFYEYSTVLCCSLECTCSCTCTVDEKLKDAPTRVREILLWLYVFGLARMQVKW